MKLVELHKKLLNYSLKTDVILLTIIIISLFTMPVLSEGNLSEGQNMTFSHPVPAVQTSVKGTHDYVLGKITLPSEYAYIRPGRSINLRITVKNQGV